MSNKLYIFLFCVFLSAVAYSQPRMDVPEMSYGFHAGAIAGMVRFDPTVKQSAKMPLMGANGGFVFRYGNRKYTAIQLELNYMRRGWRETETDYIAKLDYIEVPILMHLYVGKEVRGFLNLGPQIGVCLAQSSMNIPDEPAEQHKPISKIFDWGIAGGLGMQVDSKGAGIYMLEARFNFSLGDLYSNHVGDFFSTSAPMNLSLNIGWLWPNKRNNKNK